MLCASQGQARVTSATSISSVATLRLSSARARRTWLARSNARMYCGAGAIVAVAFILTLPVAVANLPRRNILAWVFDGARSMYSVWYSPGLSCLLFPEGSNPRWRLRANPETVMQSAPARYASVGLAVNRPPAVRTLEATFFLALVTCE